MEKVIKSTKAQLEDTINEKIEGQTQVAQAKLRQKEA